MLKPQDILVVLKIFTLSKDSWTILEIAVSLGISPSQVHSSVKRLITCHLLNEYDRKPALEALIEFIVCGIKYVFPAELGPAGRGMLTAHSYGVFKEKLVSSEAIVWPYANGTDRGTTLKPLYHFVPFAADGDEQLHGLLAVIDVFRIGRSRELAMATKELNRLLNRK